MYTWTNGCQAQNYIAANTDMHIIERLQQHLFFMHHLDSRISKVLLKYSEFTPWLMSVDLIQPLVKEIIKILQTF
jgi:hypothetical protein